MNSEKARATKRKANSSPKVKLITSALCEYAKCPLMFICLINDLFLGFAIVECQRLWH